MVFFRSHRSYFLEQGLTGIGGGGGSQSRLGWLANEPQGSTGDVTLHGHLHGAGDEMHVLRLARQALYRLGCFPSLPC